MLGAEREGTEDSDSADPRSLPQEATVAVSRVCGTKASSQRLFEEVLLESALELQRKM